MLQLSYFGLAVQIVNSQFSSFNIIILISNYFCAIVRGCIMYFFGHLSQLKVFINKINAKELYQI